MKRSALLLLLTLIPFVAFSSSTYVVIYGYVTDTNGNAVAGHQVQAMAYDSITPVTFTTHTNGNGYYEDTLFFNHYNPGSGHAWITDCDNDSLGNYNQWGSSNSAQIDFTYCEMLPSCEADFVSFPDQLPYTYNFSNHSMGDSIWFTWTFGDGASNSNDPLPTHTYNGPGDYEVCLEIWDSTGCTDMKCDTITVGPNCEADFFYQTNTQTKTVYFTELAQGDSLTYSWDFGDGGTSNQPDPVHTYNGYGTYYVCLDITDTNGCTDTYCDSVELEPYCDAHFAYQSATSNGLEIYFQDLSQGDSLTYQWSFGDGDSSSQGNPIHSYSQPGTYQVCLEVWSASGCHDIYCDSVEVDYHCEANFSHTTNGDTVFFNNTSMGPNMDYLWVFDDGDSSTSTDPVHVYDQPGTYQVCLYIENQHSCMDHYCKPVTVTKVCEANFAYQGTGDSILFYSSSTGNHLTYHWNFGDGHSSTSKNPDHVFDSNGVYNVCLTITDTVTGCTDQYCDSLEIPQVFCQAGFTYSINATEVAFTDGSAGSYTHVTWQFGDGTSSSNPNPVHNYPGVGSYQACLTIYDSLSGCTDHQCKVIDIDSTFPDTTFFIKGSIFAGNTISTNAHAVLFEDSSSVWIPVDTQYIDTFGYHFDNLDSGTYYVQAWLDSSSPYYNQYMPTYHDSAGYWQNATPITVGPNYINGDVYLQPSPPVQGNGYVSGNVTEGSGKTWGAGDPIPEAVVYLRNANDQPILHSRTDSEGRFDFEDLEEGFYTLYVEIPNHDCEPFAVTINTAADTVGNINFQVSDNEVITGLKPHDPAPELTMEVAPNPFRDLLQVTVGSDIKDGARLTIRDVNGRVMLQRKVSRSESMEISTGSLPAGMYFIELEDDRHQQSIQKAIKMK